jgi:hypothetical protein
MLFCFTQIADCWLDFLARFYGQTQAACFNHSAETRTTGLQCCGGCVCGLSETWHWHEGVLSSKVYADSLEHSGEHSLLTLFRDKRLQVGIQFVEVKSMLFNNLVFCD